MILGEKQLISYENQPLVLASLPQSVHLFKNGNLVRTITPQVVMANPRHLNPNHIFPQDDREALLLVCLANKARGEQFDSRDVAIVKECFQ